MADPYFDPYDINNYTGAQKMKSDNDDNNNLGIKKKQIFNPYENNNENNSDDDETSPLQNSRRKKQRKKTDEDLPQNIDLTKSAYDIDDSNDNNNKSENKQNENKDNNYDDKEELPLLEELGINPQNIKKKIISIITLKRIDKKFLEESDMAGPFLIIIIFAFSLVLQYKTCFGYLYGISVCGSVALFLLLNLMSENKSILLYNTISVLGYCLIPVVFLSFISVFINLKMKRILGIILSFGSIISSSISATRFFEIALEMSEQKWLIFYPICLFYTCFVLVSIF